MNEHIKSYLDFYVGLPNSPQFAVLLRGNWGCGKSFFINKYIEENGKENFLYITLNGVSSIQDVNDQIFEQLHPKLASKGMKIAGKVLTGLLKTAFKIDLSKGSEVTVDTDISKLDIPSYLANADSKIIIIDDLERCSLDLGYVLGYINQFVEQGGNKVIIIANEEEILNNEDRLEKSRIQKMKGKYENKDFEAELSATLSSGSRYLRIKEKLIGKSFELTSDVKNALNEFIKDLTNPDFIAFVELHKDHIYNLYEAAGFNNLRHLKQSILDLERLHSLLPSETFTKPYLVEDLLGTFFAFSFEIKKGNLKATDIKQLFGFDVFTEVANMSFSQKIRRKYSIRRYPLDEDLWFEFFNKGTILDSDKLKTVIKTSDYFYDENTPAHIKLWNFKELTDEKFTELYKEVLSLFEKERIQEQDLLLHITSMLLYYSDIGLIQITKKRIIQIATNNVQYLKSQKKLYALNDHYELFAYLSMGYQGKDIKEFKDFTSYINIEATKSEISSYPDLARELLLEMISSTQEFTKKISLDGHSAGKYLEIPILQHIPEEEFVKRFLELPNNEKSIVGYALSERYKYLEIVKHLKDECKWLKKVTESLVQESITRREKVSGYFLSLIINNFLKPSIKNLDSI